MFPGFKHLWINTGEVDIHTVVGGKGSALLLLHGYPQTLAMWHKIAPDLAKQFMVVATDLRGYGDSSKPFGTGDHKTYSKRAMAADQIEVMRSLGIPSFGVIGHDRGARVAHRMALDYPEYIEKLVALDILPTYEMYHSSTMEFAQAYWQWFFLTQPYDLPERLIGGDPEYYVLSNLTEFAADRDDCFSKEAKAEYIRCFSDTATIHATCEDYRASASIDLEHDQTDLHKKLSCPLLVLWGRNNIIGRLFDPISLWKTRARKVQGAELPCGHYLAEEEPRLTLEAILSFLDE